MNKALLFTFFGFLIACLITYVIMFYPDKEKWHEFEKWATDCVDSGSVAVHTYDGWKCLQTKNNFQELK